MKERGNLSSLVATDNRVCGSEERDRERRLKQETTTLDLYARNFRSTGCISSNRLGDYIVHPTNQKRRENEAFPTVIADRSRRS